MEAIKRKTFQGVMNIVRFNWHFYVLPAFIVTMILIAFPFVNFPLHPALIFLIAIFCVFTLAGILISLSVSWYVYDFSGLYKFPFLEELKIPAQAELVNINAGFDESSEFLAAKYPGTNLQVFDFYDPQKHTEISIERARKAYPSFPGTKTISTDKIPLAQRSTDIVFLILAAHEIRDEKERIEFFRQLKNALKPNGKILVVEHLRDMNNFMAYSLGFFHFHSHVAWMKTFSGAGLKLISETKHTPFLSVFILEKNDPAI
jgi:SAM-dependent methyltransferase